MDVLTCLPIGHKDPTMDSPKREKFGLYWPNFSDWLRNFFLFCTSISTTHDIRNFRQSMLKDPQNGGAENPSNTFTFWFDSPYIYHLKSLTKDSIKEICHIKEIPEEYPIKFFNTRLALYMIPIPVPNPYPIRPEIFFPIPDPYPTQS